MEHKPTKHKAYKTFGLEVLHTAPPVVQQQVKHALMVGDHFELDGIRFQIEGVQGEHYIVTYQEGGLGNAGGNVVLPIDFVDQEGSHSKA